jgi:hypothetical protein
LHDDRTVVRVAHSGPASGIIGKSMLRAQTVDMLLNY